MRTILFAAIPLVAFAQAAAQDNENIRNNEPYLVISTATHPTTTINYNYPPVNPPEYSVAGAGIPAGTWVWRTHEWQTSRRGEPHLLSGYTSVWRMSAASNGAGPSYLAKTRLMKATRDSAGVLSPDFSAGAMYHEIAQMPGPAQTATIFRVTHSFPVVPVQIGSASPSNPVVQDFALAQEYNGGEQRDLVASASQPSQGICGSWQDGAGMGYIHDGFYHMPTTTLTRKTTDAFHTWLAMVTDNPSLSIFTDYGKRRIAALTPPLPGNGYGSYFGDFNSSAVQEFGFSVRAGSRFAGAPAFILFNFQPQPFPGAIPFPFTSNPLTIELALFDPLLGGLAGLNLTLDSNGDTDSIPMRFPVLPGTLGMFIGFEAVVVDPTLTSGDTSEAVWIEIVN